MKIILYILIFIALGYFIAVLFSPGSYPFREKYELNMSQEELLGKIKKFKDENPDFVVPYSDRYQDSKNDSTDLWCHVYFYYKEDNQIVSTLVRSSDDGKVTFSLYAIIDEFQNEETKVINDNLSRVENKQQKLKFEELILNKIKN